MATVKKGSNLKKTVAIKVPATAKKKQIGGPVPITKARMMVQKAWDMYQIPAIDFDKKSIEDLMNAPKSTGLRIYLAIKEDGTPTFVYTGVTEKGDDCYIKIPKKKSNASAKNMTIGIDGDDSEENAGDMGQACDPGRPGYQQGIAKVNMPIRITLSND